jgi:hypothetical protein
VAITHLRDPSGAGSNIFDYSPEGKAEYTGSTIRGGASSPSAFILSSSTYLAVSISS